MEFGKHLPDSIQFKSADIDCICYRTYGSLFLDMGTCTLSLGGGFYPTKITPTPNKQDYWRVSIGESIWFDTDEENALKIQKMCQTPTY